MNDEMKLAALQEMLGNVSSAGPMMPDAPMGAHEAECPNCGHVFMMDGEEGTY